MMTRALSRALRAVVRGLRTRLGAYHDALRRIGGIETTVICEDDDFWWVSVATGRWWTSDAAVWPRGTSLRDVAEGLALLRALASLDSGAFGDEMRVIWPAMATGNDRDLALHHGVTLGLSSEVSWSSDLDSVMARVSRVEPPSTRFHHDMAWLEQALAVAGDRLVSCCDCAPIPVWFRPRTNYVMRCIGQNVAAQRDPGGDGDRTTKVSSCSRFKIVRVDLYPETPYDIEVGLAWYLRLAQLGIALRHVPPIEVPSRLRPWVHLDSLSSAFCVAMTLVPLSYWTGMRADDAGLAPAILSALQVWGEVETLRILHSNDRDSRQRYEAIQAVRNVWQWLAYSLFSGHAQHGVSELRLNVTYLSAPSVSAMDQVVHSAHPLAVLFGAAFEEDRWISASDFLVGDPRVRMADNERVHIHTARACCVRVIDRVEFASVVWWRVLLPGCGDAWVNGHEALEATPDTVADHTRRSPVPLDCIHISFDELTESNAAASLSLLELINDHVRRVELSIESSGDRSLDVIEWTVELMRACPKLELLELYDFEDILRLRPYVDAAEAGSFSLVSLRIQSTIHSGNSDIIDFLGMLSNESHPLTKKVKEIQLDVFEDPDMPTDFSAEWQRMLRLNRKLRRIDLELTGSRCVGPSDEQVFIYNPLPVTSKVAFLSVIRGQPIRDGCAQYRLDSNVIELVFAFSGEVELRQVSVFFRQVHDEVYYDEDY